jgi:type I restriction enzyme, R subunit
VSLRYGERVDWREYEKRIRHLLDRHVVSRDVIGIVEPLNIFDDIAIEVRRKKKVETDASIADTIAHQLTRSIEEKWEEDPIFFQKFSKLVQATIADFHKGRIVGCVAAPSFGHPANSADLSTTLDDPTELEGDIRSQF